MATTDDRAIGPYVRGRMHMAGIRGGTDLATALDVLEVVLMDTPQEALQRKRRQLDLALAQAQAASGEIDRSSWGLAPGQREETARLMSTAPR